jgi:urate oxidase
MRFATAQGFNSGDQFFSYLKDSFDVLYAEGEAGSPKMMNVGLHCRLAGRPGRLAAVQRFIDYAKSRGRVWFARRIDIARHWQRHHPPAPPSNPPHLMSRKAFVETFGGVFEHSAWIAERAYDAGLGPANDTATGLHAALRTRFRLASPEERLGVLRAHPDLAGRLAAAKKLTPESAAEQAGAGLDALTDEERQRFTELNTAYTDRFGFPFIIAVKGLDRQQILAAFEQRLKHTQEQEFAAACAQVERIALLRLKDMLP